MAYCGQDWLKRKGQSQELYVSRSRSHPCSPGRPDAVLISLDAAPPQDSLMILTFGIINVRPLSRIGTLVWFLALTISRTARRPSP